MKKPKMTVTLLTNTLTPWEGAGPGWQNSGIKFKVIHSIHNKKPQEHEKWIYVQELDCSQEVLMAALTLKKALERSAISALRKSLGKTTTLLVE